MAREPVRHENYQHDEQFTREFMSRRTAVASAKFLLPHLQPGMRVIDCGCGQGSVTVDLAEVVAPGGEAVGIDVRESDLESARELAAQRDVGNVKFDFARIYELPFSDNSFDAAVAHQVLHHLGDPFTALKEIHRVLKRGGVVCATDHAWDVVIRAPLNPALEAWDALRPRVISHIGGTPEFARNQTAVMRKAGFSRTESYLTVGRGGEVAASTPRERRGDGPRLNPNVAYIRSVARKVVLEQGWATVEEVDAMEAALLAADEDPDAMWVLPVCWALGWK